MTDWIQTTLLAFVQGVTEFLPVSSSAHLALPAILSPAIIQRSLLFDAALHGGTLAAALVFFRSDLVRLFVSCFWQTRGGTNVAVAAAREDRYFVAMLALAALPVLAAGYLLADVVSLLHRLPVIAGTTFVFGLFLWHAVRVSQKRAKSKGSVAEISCEKITWDLALCIGVGQVLALVPGVSRSGITITVGLWLGMSQREAARFSFLLAVPVIFAASAYSFWQLFTGDSSLVSSADASDAWRHALFGALVAFVFAYLTMEFFFRLLDRVGMMPFVAYRLFLGGILLLYWLFFQGGAF